MSNSPWNIDSILRQTETCFINGQARQRAETRYKEGVTRPEISTLRGGHCGNPKGNAQVAT